MRARKEMRSVTQGPLGTAKYRYPATYKDSTLPWRVRRSGMRVRNKNFVLHLYGGPYPPIPNGIPPHPWTLLTLGVRT